MIDYEQLYEQQRDPAENAFLRKHLFSTTTISYFARFRLKRFAEQEERFFGKTIAKSICKQLEKFSTRGRSRMLLDTTYNFTSAK